MYRNSEVAVVVCGLAVSCRRGWVMSLLTQDLSIELQRSLEVSQHLTRRREPPLVGGKAHSPPSHAPRNGLGGGGVEER